MESESISSPASLDEAVSFIVLMLTDDQRDGMKKYSTADEYATKVHFGLASSIRNSWGLWVPTSKLASWFRERKIWHADDMSAIIMSAVWHNVTGNEFDFDKEVQFYVKYWEENS